RDRAAHRRQDHPPLRQLHRPGEPGVRADRQAPVMRALLRVLAATLAFCAADALAITKCIDKAGKVTYQDGKCPDDSKTDALKTPIPLSPPPMSTGSASDSAGSSAS